MKKEFDVFENAGKIMHALKQGALLTTKANGKVNAMTISWGSLGIEWAKPIFVTYVREHRYTRQFLDTCGEFTVCFPMENSDKKIGTFCGTKSGKDVDKIKELNLTLVDSELLSVPAIKEYPMILECKILYKQAQDINSLPLSIREKDYPQSVDSTAPLANKDFHIAYYGEIVKAYILQ